MNIRIKATSITLTPAISAYADKCFNKVSSIIGSDPSVMCDLDIGRTSGHHNKGDVFKADIHVVGAGKNLYASAEREDLYAAMDAVRDEILHSLKSDKAKKISRIRRGGARVKEMAKGLWPWGKE